MMSFWVVPLRELGATPWRSATAISNASNQFEVAFFPARNWKAPENSKARYRAQIILIYYQKGSKTKKIGKVRGLLEVYKHKIAGKPAVKTGDEGAASWCRPKFPHNL